MLKKPGVFNRQDGVFHNVWYLCDRGERAMLFTKLAEQIAFSRKNPQGKFGSVIFEVRDVRKIRVSNRHRDGHNDEY